MADCPAAEFIINRRGCSYGNEDKCTTAPAGRLEGGAPALSRNLVKRKEEKRPGNPRHFYGKSQTSLSSSSGPVPRTTRILSASTWTVSQKMNEKVCPTGSWSSRGSIRTSPGRRARDIKGCSTSRRPDHGSGSCWPGSSRSAKMHTRAIEESGLTAADEMLYPENRSYLDDILSYEAVGARLGGEPAAPPDSQRHGHPCGNEKSDQRRLCRDAQLCRRRTEPPHVHLPGHGRDDRRQSALAHVILRGGVDKYGTCIPNYHYEDLVRLLECISAEGSQESGGQSWTPTIPIQINSTGSRSGL